MWLVIGGESEIGAAAPQAFQRMSGAGVSDDASANPRWG